MNFQKMYNKSNEWKKDNLKYFLKTSVYMESIYTRLPGENFNEFGSWPCNWLSERRKCCRLKEIFQNHLGMEPEMLAFDKSSQETSFWDLSQVGNEGPKLHEAIARSVSWNGGTQVDVTFKTRPEFPLIHRVFNLLNFEKCSSERIPVKRFP